MIISSFKGIHNTVSKRAIPDNALSDAVNVDITDAGTVVNRLGYSLAKSVTLGSVYQMQNGRAFALSGGYLCEINESLELIQLAESTATAFDDYGDLLFTNDGLMLNGQTVHDLKAMHTPTVYEPIDEASATALPQSVNDDPTTRFADRFPGNVHCLAWYDSSLYCAVNLDNQTVIWYSKPYHYHLFDYEANYLLVPGRVEVITRASEGLFIGTSTAMYLYNGALIPLARYGVVPGNPVARLPNEQILIFTQRGVCTLPFQNLTESKVSLPYGKQCATAVLDFGGLTRFVATHDGSKQAYNQAV